MKGAFLVAPDSGLFGTAKRVLISLGGQASTDDSVIQLRDETGGLFTVYRVPPGSEWEFKTGPLSSATGADIPDLTSMNGLAIECRSEFQFSAIVKAIAEASAVSMWVVDGDGVVWGACEVDASLVRL
jgi:hypothetical protein